MEELRPHPPYIVAGAKFETAEIFRPEADESFSGLLPGSYNTLSHGFEILAQQVTDELTQVEAAYRAVARC
jgi:hypothetical protein